MPPDAPTPAATPSRRTVTLIGLLLLLVAIVVVAVGVTSRRSQAARLGERAQAQAVRSVTVISPKPVGESASLDLPARIEAWSRAPIYARVSGYLKTWTADIGTRVKAGQLLAEIETWRERRHELPYETDGLVVKVDSLRQQARLGATSKAPRWAMAFKFPAAGMPTLLEAIRVQIGCG